MSGYFPLLLPIKTLFMKQKLIILFLFGTIVTSISAQNSLDRITIGLKGGLNISELKSSNPNEKSLTGLLGGIFVSVPVSNRFSCQPEIVYAQMGGKYSTDGTAWATLPSSSISFYLKYIDVPVLLKYRINKSNFSLLAGPQVSFLLSAKSEVLNESYDVKSIFKGTDIRSVFGAEYILLKGFNISARYQLGILNINSSSSSTVKNNAFSFTLGYTLDSK